MSAMRPVFNAAIGCIAVLLGCSDAGAATQCKIVRIADGFVALRAGPSANARMIVRMRPGDEVEIQNTRHDPWFDVRRWRGPIPYYKASPHPISRGYVHKRYLWNCDI